MPQIQTKQLRELSAIYLVAALLIAAAVNLGGMVIRDHMAMATERYPDLYADPVESYAAIEERVVFLTFDDGPSHNTEILLDILKEEGIPATFFVSGQTADEAYSGELLRRMLHEGHAVGLHTYTHDYNRIYRSLEDYLADLDQIRQYILDETGYHPSILRFPGGSATVSAQPEIMNQIIREVNRRGYTYYDWNVVSGDDTGKALPAGELTTNILGQAQGKQVVVVLCHDNPAPTTTPEAIKTAIHTFREQEYEFAKITTETPPIQLKKVLE